jgi:hypothetical protein
VVVVGVEGGRVAVTVFATLTTSAGTMQDTWVKQQSLKHYMGLLHEWAVLENLQLAP